MALMVPNGGVLQGTPSADCKISIRTPPYGPAICGRTVPIKPGTSSVETLYFAISSLRTSDILNGIRISLTNSVPVRSSIVIPPQFMPPSRLGHSMYGFSDGGVYMPR